MMTWANVFGEKISELHLPAIKVFSECSFTELNSIAENLLKYVKEHRCEEKVQDMEKIATNINEYSGKYDDVYLQIKIISDDGFEEDYGAYEAVVETRGNEPTLILRCL